MADGDNAPAPPAGIDHVDPVEALGSGAPPVDPHVILLFGAAGDLAPGARPTSAA
ncbi:MAG TPA: hypothetical protein VHR18_04100 [Solirubrobacterales bacterium]|nr:hypothetical protein [Solirubrobacterales bacterium]